MRMWWSSASGTVWLASGPPAPRCKCLWSPGTRCELGIQCPSPIAVHVHSGRDCHVCRISTGTTGRSSKTRWASSRWSICLIHHPIRPALFLSHPGPTTTLAISFNHSTKVLTLISLSISSGKVCTGSSGTPTPATRHVAPRPPQSTRRKPQAAFSGFPRTSSFCDIFSQFQFQRGALACGGGCRQSTSKCVLLG